MANSASIRKRDVSQTQAQTDSTPAIGFDKIVNNLNSGSSYDIEMTEGTIVNTETSVVTPVTGRGMIASFRGMGRVEMKYPTAQLSPKEQLKARVQAKRARREALRKQFPNEDPVEALANLFSHLPYKDNISDKDFD